MKVQLEVSDNKANIKRVVIKHNAVLGRSKECNLRIASSQVSRKHCRITIQDAEVYVTDLQSANGTFLNGKPIPAEQPIKVVPGTELSVGPARFVFRFEAPLGSMANDPGSTVDLHTAATLTNGIDADPAELGDEAGEISPGDTDTADQIKEAALFAAALEEPETEEDELAASDIVIKEETASEEKTAPAPSLKDELFPAEDDEEPVLEMDDEAEEDEIPLISTGEEPEPILKAEDEPEPILEAEDESEPILEAEEEPEPVPREEPPAAKKKAEPARNDEDDAFSFLTGEDEGGVEDEDLGDFFNQFN